jgi:cell division protein FtsB
MARNRKNQPAELLIGPVINAVVICSFIVICCVGYVWQKKQINDLSRQVRGQENQLKAKWDQNDKLRKQLATLMSPPALEARAKELRLGLVQPDPASIWRLPEPAVESTQASRSQPEQYAARNAGADLH